MALKLQKTQVISFSRKTSTSYCSYITGNVPINRIYETKHLGMLFDDKFLLVKHVEKIIGRARRNVGLLQWMARNLNTDVHRSVNICILLYVNCEAWYWVVWNRDRECTSIMIESVQERFLSWLKRKFYLPLSTTKKWIRQAFDFFFLAI